jgi:hypothetical protein
MSTAPVSLGKNPAVPAKIGCRRPSGVSIGKNGSVIRPISRSPSSTGDSAPLPDDVRDGIRKDIANARHYENKVVPLFMTGDRKTVRVFVQLLRDKPTCFDAEFGAPVATLRHEFWQYANRGGGWVKDRKTKVVDRTLMAKDELRLWTWVWTAELGGIDVGTRRANVEFKIPKAFNVTEFPGLVAEMPE